MVNSLGLDLILPLHVFQIYSLLLGGKQGENGLIISW